MSGLTRRCFIEKSILATTAALAGTAVMTFAATTGVLNEVWEAYIGHAPRSVTMRHYVPRLAPASMGESQALDRQLDLFRLHVTEPVNRAAEATQTGSEVLKVFEPSTIGRSGTNG